MKTITNVTVISNEEINEKIEATLIALQKNLLAEYKGISSNAVFLLGELSTLIQLKGENPDDDGRYIIMTRLLKFRYGIDQIPAGKRIKF
ncbi:hypothetical protein ACFX4N_23420 [Priestia sp. YIM B13551]|uniref:hypothetical protein n=1 Tax=Priestia sp. YIM B13551 TaxID=3366306 RepID=UPI00367004DC